MAGANSAASSLYAGIFGNQPGASSSQAQPSVSASSCEAAASQQNEQTSSTAEPALSSEPQVWSAALRFAPRKNLNANKGKRPAAAAVAHHISAAFAAPAASSSDGTVHHDEAQSSSSATLAAPDLQVRQNTEPLPRPQHFVKTHALNLGVAPKHIRPLPAVTEPPALTLSAEEVERDRAIFHSRAQRRGEHEAATQGETDRYIDEGEDEDVNGFALTSEGRKAARKKKRRRRHGSPGHHGGLVASLNMDADYDPHVPNDFNDFKALIRKRRAAVRKNEEAKKAAEVGADSVDSDDDEGDNEVYQRRRKMGRFAPPAMYTATTTSNLSAAAAQIDDAWPVVEDGEKPYLSPPPAPPPGPPPKRPTSAHGLAQMSGEEAYQRRLAMTSQEAVQRSVSPVADAMEATTATATSPKDFAARAAAASAIAARLAQAAPVATVGEQDAMKTTLATSRESATYDPSTFAERLMMKQGWTKGHALGAEGNKGLLDPILAQKVEQERVAAAQRGAHSSGGGGAPRGTLVNAREEEQRRADRRRYGEASDILLLENMISGDEEIDDDLPGEIREECAKHGFVDRVFIWPAASAAATIGRPRIFVKFTGMAGAWRCLKELDGRFFAGNTVRARYYPPTSFAKGHYDIGFHGDDE